MQALTEWASKPSVVILIVFSPLQGNYMNVPKTPDFHVFGRADDHFMSISGLFWVIETPDDVADLFKEGQKIVTEIVWLSHVLVEAT